MEPASGGPAVEGEGSLDELAQAIDEQERDERSLRFMLKVYFSFRGGALKLLAASFLSAIGGGMSWFVLILYIYELFPHLTNVTVIFSISSWVSAFLFFPGGLLVDRFERRRVLAFSLLLGASAMVVFAISQFLWMIVLGQVLNGMMMSINRPVIQAMMTEKTSDRRRKYLFSMQSVVAMFGVAIASSLAGVWTIAADAWFGFDLETSYRYMFLAAAVANIVAMFVALTIRAGEEGRESKAEELPSLVDAEVDDAEARRKGLIFIVKFSIPMMMIGFGAGFVVPFFQLYYKLKFDVEVAEIAWLFAATQIAMALSFLLIPNLAERKGTPRAIIATQGFAVVNLAIIPFAPTFYLAAPFHLMRMALMNASTPIQSSLMMGAVRPVDRGKAAAIGAIMWTVTNSLSQTLAGWVMDTYGLDAPFIIAITFYSSAVVLFWYFFRNVDEM
ncbi:MAG: MFS transporter [Thermoplasmata archaeon]|nr:MAG: MFS transporter [Thermoplasmata archaeon]